MITVVGSINMDVVVRTNRFPKQGETVMGDLYATIPGGKGANQAVAAARLGSEVWMIGAVGTDAFGDNLLNGLQKEKVRTDRTKRAEGTSGIANILLSEGDNRIIVVPGANHRLTPQDIEAAEEQLKKSQIVILQLEIPIPVILRTLQLCRKHGVPTILNPAPADECVPELLADATYLTPNETEAEKLFGEQWKAALEQYPNRIVVTLGKNGACYFDGEKHITVEGFPSETVDTTGAGDTFNGALGVALSEGAEFAEAVKFANAAASLSVEKFGAQGGMPAREDVLKRLKSEQVKRNE